MNLKKFENQELFELYKQSSNYKEPNVSLVGNTIMYNGSVSNLSGGVGYKYFDISPIKEYMMDDPQTIAQFIIFPFTVKYIDRNNANATNILTTSLILERFANAEIQFNDILCIGFDPNLKLRLANEVLTLQEAIEFSAEGALDSCIEITEEEFYNLEQ